jgi:hypothetical protein
MVMPNHKLNSRTMITKEQISELKKNNLPELYKLLQRNLDNRELLFILENLGFLPSNFDGEQLIPFTHHLIATYAFGQ